ncbi:MAG: chromate efflux transporter [Pseudomonadota bacterium]|nr:chromate efflux transporter [Pseudomonadota bacterium]
MAVSHLPDSAHEPRQGATAASDEPMPLRTPTLHEALRYWFLLGWISFGGPAGQISIMHADLVDKRRWVSDASFLRGLNFCMLLPGPEAMQLATWLGWRMHGLPGGIAAGVLFVLPGAVVLALLSWLYVLYGSVPAVAGVMFGLQAAVLGIVVHAVQRIGARVLKTPYALAIAAAALLSIAVLRVPFPAIVVSAAALGWLLWRWRPSALPVESGHGPPGAAPATGLQVRPASTARALRTAAVCLLLWWLPVAAIGLWLGTGSTSFAMGLFFSKAALVTLGGAYAVLPYVADQAVMHHAWLQPEQMMAGLGLAETTPGPLILVLQFVGFVGAWQNPDLASPLLSALLGMAITLWTTFVPCFLFVLTAAPWIERIGQWRWAEAMLAGVTAAVVGVIANLALWFGWRLLGDAAWPLVATGLALAVLAYLALARWRWPVWALIPAAGVLGLLAETLVF